MHHKIIFYNPRSTSPGKEPLPISLLQLAAQLPPDTDWTLVDGNYARQDPVGEITKHIQNPDKTLLAVTVMPGPQLAQAVPTCKQLKEIFPQLTILWGGYFPTQHTELVLKSGWVNHVAVGPSDFSFPQFVQAWTTGQELDVAGLAHASNPSKQVIKGRFKPPEQIPDLPYDQVPMERYINMNYLGKRCIGYHSSDGCPYFCSFCAVVAMADGKWQGQSANRICDNLFRLQDRYDIDSVQFFDNNFFVSQKRCQQFSQNLLASGRKLTWWGEGRIDTLLGFKQETLEQMQRSGLKMVFLGAETSSEETMALYQKGGTLTPDMTLDLAKRFGEVGIVPEFSFVLGNPVDGPDQIERDFDYIWSIKKINPASEIILYLYTPVVLPGKLDQAAKDAGFSYPNSLEGFLSEDWQVFERRRSHRLPWSSRNNHERVHEFETVLNAYFPTVTDIKLGTWQRRLLRLLASWRHGLRFYRSPLELRALHKLFRYIRPEVEGF